MSFIQGQLLLKGDEIYHIVDSVYDDDFVYIIAHLQDGTIEKVDSEKLCAEYKYLTAHSLKKDTQLRRRYLKDLKCRESVDFKIEQCLEKEKGKMEGPKKKKLVGFAK